MGKNNKARRAGAKHRSQSRTKGSNIPGSGSTWRPPDDHESNLGQADVARGLLWRFTSSSTRAIDGLTTLLDMPAAIVDGAAESVLATMVDARWTDGWQPAEVMRQGRLRCLTPAAGRLVAVAMAEDHAGRPADTLDTRWIAQVESLGLPAADRRSGWVSRWAAEAQLDRFDAVLAIADALRVLGALPILEPILPPPGSDVRSAGRHFPRYGDVPGAQTDPMLVRIRALLAKAESTTFEAEAMAFTAKAQELMTRHAIDGALVDGSADAGGDQPVATRVPIDAPYVDAKSLLLQTVAKAGRCRTVFDSRVAMSTLVGFAADVHATETLFTSLLLQAQTALADAGRRAPAGTRTRSKSFRSAFLFAYTLRIGDRLQAINDEVYAEVRAERGAGFLPVLRSRAAKIDDYVAERFGTMAIRSVRRSYDLQGWATGTTAADNAKLNAGDLTRHAAAS